MKNKIFALLMSFLLVFAMVGCGNSNNKAAENKESNKAANSAEENQKESEDKKDLKGTTLKVFYAYGGTDKIFSEFEKDTGIKIEGLDMSSGEVLARIRAEEGKPSADVWFGGGSDSFIAAKNDGLLEKYVSPEAENVDQLFKDKDGYWTGVSLVTVSFIVNKDLAEEKGIEIPQTWEELTKPEFKDEILMSNPSISGTAYTILDGLLQSKGEEEGWAFFEKINENIPFYAKRGSEPPKKAALGEALVGLAPGTGEDLKAEGYPIVAVFPKDGTPWWPAPMSILKGSENMDAAKVFVDWCLSKRGQEVLKEASPRVPARSDVEPPETLKGIKDAELMDIDFVKAGNERDSVVEKWEKEFSK